MRIKNELPRNPRLRRSAFGRALLTILLAAGTTLSGPAAYARTYQLTMVGSALQVESDAAVHSVVFDGGTTSLDFRLATPSTVAFFFSSECSVGASDSNTWIDLDIRVDGVSQRPTWDDNAFCTSRGSTSVNAYYRSASADAVGSFSAGVHTVDVTARLAGWSPGESWRLAEKTLVILIAEDD